MTEQQTRRSYPFIPAKSWWELRRKFMQAPPRQVTAGYLQTVLGIEEKSAKNLMPPLRAVGLIDADGRLTDLANDWRTDEHYADACQKVIESLYPHELRDAHPNPDADRDAVERWFMRTSGTGRPAANRMAALYILVSQADPSAQNQDGSGRVDKPTERRQRQKQAQVRVAEQTDPRPVALAAESSPARMQRLPNVHIDVQIHISPDAAADQIDQIFASMARHLYGGS